MDDEPQPEFRRLARSLGDLPTQVDVPLSIGDDGAHLLPPPGGLIAVADMMTEGIHFRLSYTPFDALGHKILAVNLSDIAAMGATPRYALLTLGVPTSVSDDDIAQVFSGLKRLGALHNVALVGGDLTAAPEGAMVASLTCLGSPGPRGPITRRGAQPGDAIGIIGTLGGAGYALERLEGGERPKDVTPAQPWAGPLLYPAPQVQAGIALGERGVSALMDISDGLLSDLRHILARGILGGGPQLGAEINLRSLPLSPSLMPLPQDIARRHALYGGEDYALLLTAPPSEMSTLVEDLGVCVIGEITPEPAISFMGEDPPKGSAWDHFKGGTRG